MNFPLLNDIVPWLWNYSKSKNFEHVRECWTWTADLSALLQINKDNNIFCFLRLQELTWELYWTWICSTDVVTRWQKIQFVPQKKGRGKSFIYKKSIITLKQFDEHIIHFRKLLLNRVRTRAYKRRICKPVCQWLLQTRWPPLEMLQWKLGA